MHVKYEDQAIYLSKDDADFQWTENAFWIDLTQSPKLKAVWQDSPPPLTFFDGKQVIDRGYFNYDNAGHLDSYAGTIERVDSIGEERQWYDGAKDVSAKPDRARVH